ncbi:MAG: hypothetical protein H7144_10030 [Burkholderiales bacterium]|nr:hypothetical protein [Phycisphaerae bacterium]
MIIAGIDEAGYGPLLGPLVVGCCAFRVPDPEAGSGKLPCVWKLLSRVVGKNRCRHGRKLHVNDSKAVYNPTAGLKELERAVLCLLSQPHGIADDIATLLRYADPALAEHLAGYRWYDGWADERFPIQADGVAVRISANAFKIACEQAQTRCVHYIAHVLLERQFNDLVDKTRNKASASFTLVARHIDRLLQTYAAENLLIFCDRQGGREHYGHLLRVMFEDWALEIISETEKRAEYRLVNRDRSATIIFCEKAESLALPVAAASMLAKYLRESLMSRFNRYWQTHLPDLAPTAGYYNDGWRFLRDIQEVRASLGVNDAELIRQR